MRTWEVLLRERLATDAEEATEYLRATYEEKDPQISNSQFGILRLFQL
jgi:hypothetical protein